MTIWIIKNLIFQLKYFLSRSKAIGNDWKIKKRRNTLNVPTTGKTTKNKIILYSKIIHLNSSIINSNSGKYLTRLLNRWSELKEK